MPELTELSIAKANCLTCSLALVLRKCLFCAFYKAIREERNSLELKGIPMPVQEWEGFSFHRVIE